MVHATGRFLQASVTGLVVVTVGSCTLSPARIAPPVLPPELEQVVDNKDEFLAGQDSPLADVIPGTPVNNLMHLSGCWGVYVPEADIDIPLAAGLQVDSFGSIRFEPDDTSVTQSVLISDAAGRVSVLVIESGTYELLDDSRILLTFDRFWGNDPGTGEIVEILDSQPTTSVLLATLYGDWLSLWPESEQITTTSDFLVHRRFDCPTDGG